jgi:hypothetical protein
MSIMVFLNRRFFLLLALAESAQVGLVQIMKQQVIVCPVDVLPIWAREIMQAV